MTITDQASTPASWSEPSYGERWDVFCAIPSTPNSLLDVGCGTGMGFASYRKRGTQLVGVDNDPEVLREAARNMDETRLFDLEADSWPAEYRGRFDVVAFCDCLEHVLDPWAVLNSIRPLLSENGVVVASVPNVRQIRIIVKLLLLGKWDYVQGAGTIQRAHLRFFTQKTIRDMFVEAGYHEPQFFYPRRTFHLHTLERLLNAVTIGKFADLFYGSYTVSARPRSRN